MITNLLWNGGGSDVAWVNANLDTARFGGVGGIVTLGENITAGGLTFNVTGYEVNGASTLTLGGATPTVTVTNLGETATLTAAVAGTAGLTKSGNGTLVLAANNAGLNGTIAINQGILSISADNQLGAGTNGVVLDTGGSLRQALNGTVTLGAGRTITVGVGGGTIDVVNTGPTGKLLLSTAGQLLGSGVLTKVGNGTFQLSQANTAFAGTLTVNAGQVEAQNGTVLGLTPAQVTVGGTGEFIVTNLTWAGPIVANTGGTISGNSGNSTFTGGITANGAFNAAVRDFNATTNARTLTLSGPIVGAGALTVTAPSATNTGTLVLSGDNSAFSGNVSIPTRAIVQIGAKQSIGTGGFTLNGGMLRIAGAANLSAPTVGVNGLNGTYLNFGSNEGSSNIGVITGVGGTPSVKFAQDQLYLTPRAFSRTDAIVNIPNSGSGTHTIVPIAGYDYFTSNTSGDNSGGMWKGLVNITNPGSYTFTSASDDNSAVWIDGVLVVNADTAAGKGVSDITGSVTLTSGFHSIVLKWAQGAGGSAEILSYNGPDTGSVKVLLGSTPGTVTTGSLAATEIGALTLAASSTYDFTQDTTSASATLGTGTLTLTSVTVSGHTVTGATTLAGNPTLAPTTGALTLGGQITGTGDITVAGPFLTTFSGNSNNYVGAISVTGGQLSLNGSGGSTIPGNLLINAANANGAVANVKLLAANQIADTSAVTVTQGILDVGAFDDTIANLTVNGGAIIGTGTLTVANAPTLNSGTINAGLGGTYNLVKAGAGTVILGGANSYAGVTNVNGGILQVQSAGALGLGGAGNETIIANGAVLRTLGANLGTENVTVNGTGIAGDAMDGALRNPGGTSTINDLVTGSASTVRVDSGELIIIGTLNVAGGALTKSGSGTLTFATNQATLPAVTLAGGALGFSGPQSFGAAVVPAGLAYQFNSNPGGSVAITAPAGTTVIGNYAVDQAFLGILTAGSAGTLALTGNNANSLNFSAGPNVTLGATVPVIYSGAITPNGANYRLGGGAGALNLTSALTGANTVEISGRVQLSAVNTSTGGITVQNGGRLVYVNDTNLGNASNVVTLNGGTLQFSNASDNTGVTNFGYLGNPNGLGTTRVISIGAGGGTIDLPARQGGNGGSQFGLMATNQLTGSGPLTKTGLGGLYIMSSNNFSGSLTVAPNGGRVGLRGGGALPNVASITLGTATELDVDNNNGLGSRITQGTYVGDRVNNIISPFGAIMLTGGSILYTPRGAAGQLTETFGPITLAAAQSAINANSNPGGSVGAVITFGALTQNVGSTVRFGGNAGAFGAGTAGAPGANNTQVVFTSGLAATNAIGRASIFGTDLVAYDAALGVKISTYTAQGAAAFTPVAANVYNLNAAGTATLNAGDSEMLGLRFGSGNNAQVLAFNVGTQRLAITSGGIIHDNNNQNRDIGTSALRGVLTAGPLTGNAAPRELFLHSTNGNLRVFSQVVDNNGQTVSVVKDLDGTATLDATNNTYSGGTFVNRGTLTITGASGLGSGPVQVRNARLNLNAAGSTTAATGAYSALDQGEILLAASTAVYTAAGDRFTIGAGSSIISGGAAPGANQGLNSLTRVTSLTAGGQIVLQPDAIVSHQYFINGENGIGTNTIKNLGTNADVFFGLSTNAFGATSPGGSLTVGAGTPWKGISTDRNPRSWSAGTIFANSDFTLQGLTRDGGQTTLTLGAVNSPGGISIINNTNSQIRASIVGTVAIGEDTTISMPSSVTLVVTGNSQFFPNSSMATGDAQVLVQNGGTLDPGNYVVLGAAANQNVNPDGTLNGFQNLPYPVPSPIIGATTVEAGGRFLINDGSGIGSAPTGTFTLKSGSILELGATNAFFGRGDYSLNTALPVDTTGLAKVDQFNLEQNVLVRVSADNIYKFSQFIPTTSAAKTPIIEIAGANRNLTNQNNPFTIPVIGTPTIAADDLVLGNGVILTNDTADRQLNEGRGIFILNDGAVLVGTSQTYLNIQEAIQVTAGATITIGSTTWADGTSKLGGVQLTGPNSNIIPDSATINILNGAQLAFGAGNVWPDTRALNLPIAVTTFPVAVAQGAQPLQPGNGTSLLMNVANFAEIVGAVTGNGAVIANQGGTFLAINSPTDFSTNVVFKNTNGQQPNLWKIGSSVMTYTGTSDSTGQVWVGGGELKYSGAGNSAFGENRLQKGGLLTLDNAGTALSNRLGGITKSLTPMGGTINLIGHATTAVQESFANTFNSAGGSGPFAGVTGYTTLKVTPGAATTTVLINAAENFQSAGIAQQRSGTWVINSTTVANVPITYTTTGGIVPDGGNLTNGLVQIASPNFTTGAAAFAIQAGGVFGSAGTRVAAMRPDYLGDANGDGIADGLMTEDGVFLPSANTSGTAVVTGLPSTTGFTAGMLVQGAGVPVGTRILTVDSGSQVTLTNSSTAAIGSLQVISGGMRNLVASEYSSSVRDNQNNGLNVKLSGSTITSGDTRVSSLTLGGGSTLNINGTLPLGASASRVVLNSGGVFVQGGGTATVNGSAFGTSRSFLQANGGASLFLHTIGDLNLNAAVMTDSAIVKTGAGTVNVGDHVFDVFRGTLEIDGGIVNLGTNNTFANIRSQNGSTSNNNLYLNAGTLNLNGNNQMINVLSNNNELVGLGGTVTSPTAATLTVTGGGRFSGTIAGAISLDKNSGSTLILTNENGFTGTTAVRGGNLTLRDSGLLSGTSGINVQNATLQLDNGYLSNVPNRILPTTPVSLYGATVNLTGAAAQVATQTFNSVTLAGGLNSFTSNAGGSGANEVSIGNLSRAANSGAIVTFNQTYGFLGTAGNNTTAIRDFISNVNGSPIALTNNILPAWIIANGDHFATYNATTGLSFLSNTADGYANYESGDATTATATQNVNDGNARTFTVTKTINAWRMAPGAAIANTFNNGVGLTIGSGGLISNANVTISLNAAADARNNSISSSTGELSFWVNQNTSGINIPITGAIDFVKTGPGSLNLNTSSTLNGTVTSGSNLITTTNTTGLQVGDAVSGTGIPAGTVISIINAGASIQISNNATAAATTYVATFGNTYAGKTYVNGGTLTLNQPAASQQALAIPGDLVINAATVTEANMVGQLKTNANITIGGGGRFNAANLAGVTETIGSLTFLDGSSNAATANGIDRTALQLNSIVNLSAPVAITSTNTNPSVGVPFIGGFTGIIGFTNASGAGSTLNINSPTAVNGILAVGLRIGSVIGAVPTGVAEGGLIKAGTGLLTIDPDQNPTFAGGATTTGSNVVTMTSTTGLIPGQTISGTGIPANSYIVAVTSGTGITISQNATATGTALTLTGNSVNQFNNPAVLTDVFNIQSGTVRVDRSGSLGNNFANTVVQSGAILLGSNNANVTFTGSVTLKDAATLGATINSFTLGAATYTAANQSVLNVPSGTANIAAYDYYVPGTNNGNVTINGRLTGAGNLTLVGPQITQGTGGGGVITFGNPLLSGAGAGQCNYTGTINVGINAILQNQIALIAGATQVRSTGDALGSASINLNGGRLRFRDDATSSATAVSNTAVSFIGHNVTLSENSYLDAGRANVTDTISGNIINLGTLTVAAGTKVLNVDSNTAVTAGAGLGNYQVGFTSITGPGTLIKGGNGRLNITAIGGGFTGGLGLAGPQGLVVAPAFNTTGVQNLVLPTTTAVSSFSLGGFYITEASKTLNVSGTFAVNSNAGDIASNKSNVSARLAVTNTSTISAGVFQNNGLVGGTGGAATITASAGFTGSGQYEARTTGLTLAGNLTGGTPKFTGDNTTVLTGTAHSPAGAIVQSGTLKFQPTGVATSSGTLSVLSSPASVASGTSAPIAAVSSTLEFAAGANSIKHTGNINNSGLVRVSSGIASVTGTIGGTSTQYVPGLLEGFTTAPGGVLTVDGTRVANPGNFGIQSEPRMLQTNAVTQQALTGHTDNDTWIYTGYVKDNDGVFSFAENIDDRAAVWIDGTLVLNAANGGASRVVSTAYQHGQAGTGVLTANSNLAVPSQNFGAGITLPGYGSGWHLLEIRMNNGAGGAGPITGNGFGVNYGFGYKDGIAALDGADMIKPIDDGTGNLFVTAVNAKGSIQVDNGATLNVGNFTETALVAVGTGGTPAFLNIAASSDTDALVIGDGSVVTLGVPVPALPPFAGAGALDEGFLAGQAAAPVQGVPEPGSAALLLGGVLTLLGMRRRRS